ncbi:5'-3' exonuclease [Anoxybacillus gonensis]|uniref:5'-3' exonuclease n=1 Tax=Anoxybacillus gonensis TaxID=198467 RepID=A0AAW7TJM4_9BACL|nr:5'-3' exonuclease [Anoxybacillus gonensis]AKS38535.1 5'-3' exonuclease [Anoxybacillus gonensis]KGP59790.1 5'-3' exonuclease [Anoxybacillus gonensis]MDO0878254.1 5'-3' exonuclease [Anoxybacillus gonensis]
MEREHLLLIDGMALLFRSFYATAPRWMMNSRGVPTNAVYGVVKHIEAATNALQPTHVVCCWDMGSTTFRTEWFPDYKANRGEPPRELIPQFDLAKEVVAMLGIPNIGVLGAEADDCIGSLVKQYREEMRISIMTGDRDLFQLLSERVTVYLLAKGIGNYEAYTLDRFIEEKGIQPQQLIDVKALMGDPSDNYPGVRGIGEKQAVKLIQQYGSIEGIIANLANLTKAQQQKITEHLDLLHLSRKLAAIHCDIPIQLELEEAKWHDERKRFAEVLEAIR